MLTAQFLLGLKPEIRSSIEMQLPDSVVKAAILAFVQEQLLERTRKGPFKGGFQKTTYATDKSNHKSTISTTEL
jgi:hypothetical protein